MTEPRLGHLDESGQVCGAHVVDLAGLLRLAALGSRASSFNHDIASKIQGVMMALDEIAELATGELVQVAQTAQTALTELNQLLQQQRALTKPPVAMRMPLHELVSRAAVRVGVTLRGARATCEVEVAMPISVQALALAFEAAAGSERRRAAELAVDQGTTTVELRIPYAATATPAGEALAIAAWILESDGGELRCSSQAIVVRLPIAK